MANAIGSCPESSLEGFWSTELGDRYWALVRSGIQSEPLTSSDQLIKDKAIQALDPSRNGGFGTPGSTNAFLISMMYFEPGTMKVDNPDLKIPSWILPFYDQIFTNSQ